MDDRDQVMDNPPMTTRHTLGLAQFPSPKISVSIAVLVGALVVGGSGCVPDVDNAETKLENQAEDIDKLIPLPFPEYGPEHPANAEAMAQRAAARGDDDMFRASSCDCTVANPDYNNCSGNTNCPDCENHTCGKDSNCSDCSSLYTGAYCGCKINCPNENPNIYFVDVSGMTLLGCNNPPAGCNSAPLYKRTANNKTCYWGYEMAQCDWTEDPPASTGDDGPSSDFGSGSGGDTGGSETG